jgi:hypothetical protein
MSDGVQILLFCLGLTALVALVIGPLMYFSRNAKGKGRGRSNESATTTMNDINNIL